MIVIEMRIATVFPRLNPDPFGMILASVIQLLDVQNGTSLGFRIHPATLLKNGELVVTAKSNITLT